MTDEDQLFSAEEEHLILYGSTQKEEAKRQRIVLDAVKSHPKRRGELRSEYERRILMTVRAEK